MDGGNVFDRAQETRGRLSRRREPPPPSAGAVPCKTVAGEAYPSGPDKYYLVQPIAFTGPVAEGGALTESESGAPFLAACLGSAGPPEGARVIVRRAGGRWVFQYYLLDAS